MTPRRSDNRRGPARAGATARTSSRARTNGRPAGRPPGPPRERERSGDRERSTDRGRGTDRGRSFARPASLPQGERRERRPAPPAAIEAALRRQPWDSLRTLLQRIEAPENALERLKAYTRLVLEWNRGVSNIVARGDEPRLVERHLIESISPARALRESGATRWIDFGSGAGLPAVPLAIAGVGTHWTLVESRRMKTLFLRKVIHEIGLQYFDVINDRLENAVLDPALDRDRDGFTSRATMALAPTLELAAPLVRASGSAFLWKGSRADAEMAADPSWRKAWDHSASIPVGSGPNIVARFIRK